MEDGCVLMAVELAPKPRIRYDPDHDILYILFEEGPVDDTIEAGEDVFVELREGRVIGIEVWRAERIIEVVAEKLAEKLRRALRGGETTVG